MAVLDTLRRWFTTERKFTTFDLARDVFGGRAVKSGATVNWRTALEVSTVLACARVIAEGLSQVPLKLYRETGKTRLPATDHPLYNVLHRRPNGWQTSFEFRETLVLHLVLTGNAFCFINRVRGRIQELVPFEPGQVTVTRGPDGSPMYRVTQPDKQQKDFPAESIWHLRGPSWNGYLGLEAVHLAREAIGLALSTEESHALLHRNGVQVSGTYSVEGTLSPQQYEALYTWVAKYQKGGNQHQGPLILDRSAKWLPNTMNGVDSQHLETRKFQIEEICRALRVMPIMVGYSDKAATYASAEQMFLAHVVHTLAPWYERIEQSIDVNLLTPADQRDGVYAKFVEEGLLRGAMSDTADYLVKLTTNGILTRNEARAKLDENPIVGLDDPLTPVNLTGSTDDRAAESDNAKRLAAHEKLLARIEARATQPQPQPAITINQAPITVTTPAVQVDNHLPPANAPDVNVAFEATMPEVKAPDVHVSNVMQEIPAPVVTVNVKNDVPPAEVVVQMPARKTETTVTERDDRGNLVRTTAIESDL